MSAMASQITGVSIVCSTVCSDKKKHQSSVALAFVRGIHRRPVISPHNGPVTGKMFPFDDVTMIVSDLWNSCSSNKVSATGHVRPSCEIDVNIKLYHEYHFV